MQCLDVLFPSGSTNYVCPASSTSGATVPPSPLSPYEGWQFIQQTSGATSAVKARL